MADVPKVEGGEEGIAQGGEVRCGLSHKGTLWVSRGASPYAIVLSDSAHVVSPGLSV